MKKQNIFISITVIFILLLTLTGCSSEMKDFFDEESSNPIINTDFNSNTEDNFTHEITNEYTDELGLHHIEGTVTNNNNKDYQYVEIEFICYDDAGNNLGTAIDNTNNLLGKETWRFSTIDMFSEDIKINHCNFHKITAY